MSSDVIGLRELSEPKSRAQWDFLFYDTPT